MKLICDNCNKEFKLSRVKLKKKKVSDEIIKIFYRCPKCKCEYIVAYQDEEVRENIKRIKELSYQLVNGDRTAVLKIQNLKERNLELSNRYKALFR